MGFPLGKAILLLGGAASAIYVYRETVGKAKSGADEETPTSGPESYYGPEASPGGVSPDYGLDGVPGTADDYGPAFGGSGPMGPPPPGAVSDPGPDGIPGTADDIMAAANGLSPFDAAYLNILGEQEKRLTDEQLRLMQDQAAKDAADRASSSEKETAAAAAYQAEFERQGREMAVQGNLGNALFGATLALQAGSSITSAVRNRKAAMAASEVGTINRAPKAAPQAKAGARAARAQVATKAPTRVAASKPATIRVAQRPAPKILAAAREAEFAASRHLGVAHGARPATSPGRSAAAVVAERASLTRGSSALSRVISGARPVARIAARAALPVGVAIAAYEEKDNIAQLAQGYFNKDEYQRGSKTYESARSIARTGTQFATLGLLEYDPGSGGALGDVHLGGVAKGATDFIGWLNPFD